MSTNSIPQVAQPLCFQDAIKIAKGCNDYSGGYRGDPALHEAYRAGIATVVNALNAANNRGLADTQIRILHTIGENTTL